MEKEREREKEKESDGKYRDNLEDWKWERDETKRRGETVNNYHYWTSFRFLFSILFYRIAFYSNLIQFVFISLSPPVRYLLVGLAWLIFSSLIFYIYCLYYHLSPFFFLISLVFLFSTRRWQKHFLVVGKCGTFFKKLWKRAWRLQRRGINLLVYRLFHHLFAIIFPSFSSTLPQSFFFDPVLFLFFNLISFYLFILLFQKFTTDVEFFNLLFS